jgi:hypothetical protein
MAITTIDGAIAGMQPPVSFAKNVTGTMVAGRHHSLFYLAGYPGAASAPAPGLKGAALTTYAGQIPFSNPGSGNTYLARLQASATIAGTLMLCDRLWHNSGISITTTPTAQLSGNTISTSSVANPTVITCSANHPFANGDSVIISGHTGSTPAIDGVYTISNVAATTFTIPVNVSVGGSGGTVGIAFPARDANGTVSGKQVYLGVEVSTVTSTNAPTLTLNYTNNAGVGNRSGVNIVPTVASSIAGTFYPIGLQAGDTGVRSVQSIALSASWTSGTIHVVAYRILASLELTAANIPNAIDALTSGFTQLYNNTVPFLVFLPSTTTTSNISGQIVYSQG